MSVPYCFLSVLTVSQKKPLAESEKPTVRTSYILIILHSFV